jgi:hypothetical protein
MSHFLGTSSRRTVRIAALKSANVSLASESVRFVLDLIGACPRSRSTRWKRVMRPAAQAEDDALGVVISQSMWAPKHRHLTVRILMHPHRHPDKVRAQAARWQLQTEPLSFHRIVLAHRAVLLHALDLLPPPVRSTTNADPSCSAWIANRPL